MPKATEGNPIRVLIVDDHAVVREGIRHVLTSDTGFQVVGEAATGSDAVTLAAQCDPDVIVLDLSMPGMSGLDAAPRLRSAVPRAHILVLSIHDHEEYILQSVRAGAAGYLLKDSSPAELRTAIRELHAGRNVFSAPATRSLSTAAESERRLADLTSREREVLIQIARGASNKEIAALLRISVRTVESHRDALARKLQLKGAASLTKFAIDAGLLRA